LVGVAGGWVPPATPITPPAACGLPVGPLVFLYTPGAEVNIDKLFQKLCSVARGLKAKE